MKGANILANFFNWNREVIESAETPFAKLAIFVLPVLAPLVPAFMTSLHMFKLMTDIFDFARVVETSATMSIITGIVLELLGYVGAITFIRSLFQYVKHRHDEELLPVILNGLAYLFYIVAMFLINVQLGKYFGSPTIINSIFGLLSFITVPTGLLAANHLSQRADEEHEDKKVREDRAYKLERLKIIHGEKTSSNKKDKSNEKHASWYKDKMVAFMGEVYKHEGKVPTVIQIAQRFSVDYQRSKGFISGLRTKYMKDNNIKKD
jgi:hypothetical protein